MNKDCEIIRDLLPLYVDDVCSTWTKELVEKHLQNCNECQKILKNMEKDEHNINSNEKESIKSFNNKIILTEYFCVIMIYNEKNAINI